MLTDYGNSNPYGLCSCDGLCPRDVQRLESRHRLADRTVGRVMAWRRGLAQGRPDGIRRIIGMCEADSRCMVAVHVANVVPQGKVQRMSQAGRPGGKHDEPKHCERAVPHAILSP